MFSEFQKKIIKIATKVIYKKLKTSPLDVHNDLKNTGNPVVAHLYKLLLATSANIKHEHQSRVIVKEFGGLLLWIAYKDTAYRDVFFWLLRKLFDYKDVINPLIDEYYKEPSDFYCNLWQDSMDDTDKQRLNGEIPYNEMSIAEQPFKKKK